MGKRKHWRNSYIETEDHQKIYLEDQFIPFCIKMIDTEQEPAKVLTLTKARRVLPGQKFDIERGKIVNYGGMR